eukprot:CAMPEP_0119488570 /NCGR_PEP_ID=MMETSP1344-20130328/14309_1 /TAXON_ID=236787 /ORGANISM="Florenciella parvula, Strain CCMP2471" /LENGTH=53 /DNA_ID=CAMNT_0007523535 /DNA_START=438 /DNA_END=599 /DNA_ORIENTATION=+
MYGKDANNRGTSPLSPNGSSSRGSSSIMDVPDNTGIVTCDVAPPCTKASPAPM